VKVSGGRVALWTPGASVRRGPGVGLGCRWPGRGESSGPIVGPADAGALVAAAGRSATGGWSGAFGFYTWALA
jgi:hypothetical protein